MTPRELFQKSQPDIKRWNGIVNDDYFVEHVFQVAFSELANRERIGNNPQDAFILAGKLAGAREVLDILRNLGNEKFESPKTATTTLDYGSNPNRK